jgi:MFS family permease
MSEILDPKSAPAAGRIAPSTPEALQYPTSLVSLRFQLLLGLAGLGIWLTTDPVITLLIPTQVSRLSPTSQATSLAIIATAGALVALVTNIVVGALSDRTTSPLGRRRPWIMAGAVATAAALALLASAPSIAVLILVWMLAQASSNSVICTTAAAIPDRVPDRQKGLASAIYGLAVPLSLLVGSILVGQVIADVAAGYLALAVLMLLLVAPFALTQREPALPRGAVPPLTPRGFLAGFWINPRRHPDFAVAWITRFLVILGYALGVGSFLFLYVEKVLGYEQLFPGHEVKEGVATLLAIAIAVEIPAALVAAILSDRLQRRKVFVVASSIAIAAALTLIGVVQTWAAAQVAAVIIGIGFGAYIAVDSALLAQVLPSTASRGRDLGIMNVSNLVPGTLAPLIGAGIINAFGEDSPAGYTTLYLVGALLTLVSAVLIRKIKSVR